MLKNIFIIIKMIRKSKKSADTGHPVKSKKLQAALGTQK